MPDVDELPVIHEAGEERRLGLLEQPEESLTCSWSTFSAEPEMELIPESDWQECSLKKLVKAVNDQDGVGMCASAGTQNTVENTRHLAGLEYVPLSAGDLYKRVSGGRDQGSLPEDNLKELLTNGIAPVSVVPYLDWRNNHAGAAEARKPFRGLEASRCPTFGHVASAIQKGFVVLIGYWHYQSDPVDGNGWLRRPSGRKGGHAVCGVSLVRDPVNGGWGLEYENTWTVTWGNAGFGILPRARVEAGIRSFQAWTLRCTLAETGTMPPLIAA